MWPQHHHPSPLSPKPNPLNKLTGIGSYSQIPPLAKSSVSSHPVSNNQNNVNAKFPPFLNQPGSLFRYAWKTEQKVDWIKIPSACNMKKIGA